MYFSFYPKIAYKIDDYDYLKAIDITNAIVIKNYIKNYRGIRYVPYIILDGERPDNVSKKQYGDERYAWIILLTNDIISIYDEWPKNSKEMIEFIEEKYDSINYATSTIKSYYDSRKNEIDITTYNSLSVDARSFQTYYDYEVKLNDAKSKIKIISASLINQIESDIKKALIE